MIFGKNIQYTRAIPFQSWRIFFRHSVHDTCQSFVLTCSTVNPVFSSQLIWYSNTFITVGYTQNQSVKIIKETTTTKLIILATKIVSRCRRTLRVEGHSVAGCGIGGTVKQQTAGPKIVRLGNGLPPIALHCLLLMLVSKPLQIANHYYSGFPVSGGI